MTRDERDHLLEIEEAPRKKPKRTPAQNNSMHLWLTDVATELNKQGQTLQAVVAQIKRAEVRPTMENLKEVVWRPYQIAAFGKESTTELTTEEVDKVYEGLNKFFGEHFGIHVPFPSQEGRSLMTMESTIGWDIRNTDQYPPDPPEGILPTI
jgi:hypothetical protein